MGSPPTTPNQKPGEVSVRTQTPAEREIRYSYLSWRLGKRGARRAEEPDDEPAESQG